MVICTIGGGSSFGRIHGIGFRAIQSWNDEFTRLQLLTLEKGRKEGNGYRRSCVTLSERIILIKDWERLILEISFRFDRRYL